MISLFYSTLPQSMRVERQSSWRLLQMGVASQYPILPTNDILSSGLLLEHQNTVGIAAN